MMRKKKKGMVWRLVTVVGGTDKEGRAPNSESGCRVNSSSDHKSSGGGEQLKRSDVLNAIARGASPLLRQLSFPPGSSPISYQEAPWKYIGPRPSPQEEK
ncbi:unnamed protein product [Linum trigynum]|uniref:Uncharacterized protein n=1 Tax=Linum trigynum TaxID=586398 RepID=A0AAV2EDU1_9ROSI